MSRDPRPALHVLGLPYVQDVEPGYGYSGPFDPEHGFVMVHWTASAAGSNVASSVLHSRSYHACVDRDGLIHLGGWNVRQGHGGWGRVAPLELARAGELTLDDLYYWQRSISADDTDDWPNHYGLAVCLDVNGVDEEPSAEQFDGWAGCVAAFLSTLGLGLGCLVDHASSTNRKVDLTAVVPILDPAEWRARVGWWLDRLEHPQGDGRHRVLYRLVREQGTGHCWLSDKLTVRWLETEFDVDDAEAQLERYGYPTDWFDASREAIRDLREHGVIIGPEPPW